MKQNHGLKITWKAKWDPRKLSRKKKFGSFDASQIPDFDLDPNAKILDQGLSSMCTAFANCGVSGVQEGVELSPEFAFQKTNLLSGLRHSDGADPDKAFKVHTKFGCIEQRDNPFKLAEKGQYAIEDPIAWDSSLDELALDHRKFSYMECDQAENKFDSIRIAMYQSYLKFQQTNDIRDKKLASVGFYWLPSFTYAPNGIIPNDTSRSTREGSGHNVRARGQKTINGIPYLIIQNSYGTGVGDNGLHYFPREVINKYVAFAKTFEDIDSDNEKQIQWNILAKMVDVLTLMIELIRKTHAGIINKTL